jgi:hypothetical protein
MPAGIGRPGIQRPIVQIYNRLFRRTEGASSFLAGPEIKTRHSKLRSAPAGSRQSALSTEQKTGPEVRGRVLFYANFLLPIIFSHRYGAS